MPTVHVNLLDTKVTLKQKRELAESITKIVSETLGESSDSVTILFSRIARDNIARNGMLEKR